MTQFKYGAKPLTVLVAGGAGFVGQHLCRALRSLNHRVTALDNQRTGSFTSLNQREIECIDGDVTRELDLIGLPLFDVIVHLASPAAPDDYQGMPVETLLANTTGTINLLELAARNKARFVYASTSEVYGDPLVHPQPETYRGNVDTMGPRAMYDESKRMGETIVSVWRREYGVESSVLRIFNAYGPGMRDDGRMVPSFVRAALRGEDLVVHGDGSQTRCLTYVSDLVSALLLVIGDANADGLVVNVGSTLETTVRQVAELTVSLAGSSSSIIDGVPRAGDPQRRRPCIDRIYDRYRWQAVIGLEAGLKRTIEAEREAMVPR